MLEIAYANIMLLRLITLIKLVISYSIYKTDVLKYLETLPKLYF